MNPKSNQSQKSKSIGNPRNAGILTNSSKESRGSCSDKTKQAEKILECPVCCRRISKDIWDKQEKKAEENEICDCCLYLEIEQLEKENEELKDKVEYYKKLHLSLGRKLARSRK